MNVAVWSHFRDERWSGDVPLQPSPGLNEELFRFFNRVDEADADRLDAIGYRLPSLSVGDTVSYDGRTFRVEGLGFAEVPS